MTDSSPSRRHNQTGDCKPRRIRIDVDFWFSTSNISAYIFIDVCEDSPGTASSQQIALAKEAFLDQIQRRGLWFISICNLTEQELAVADDGVHAAFHAQVLLAMDEQLDRASIEDIECHLGWAETFDYGLFGTNNSDD